MTPPTAAEIVRELRERREKYASFVRDNKIVGAPHIEYGAYDAALDHIAATFIATLPDLSALQSEARRLKENMRSLHMEEVDTFLDAVIAAGGSVEATYSPVLRQEIFAAIGDYLPPKYKHEVIDRLSSAGLFICAIRDRR